jgi:hypothetical protein
VDLSVILGALLAIAAAAAALLWRAHCRSEEARQELTRRLEALAADQDHRHAHRLDRLQAVGEALAGMAHDLNSALAVVIMNLDLMQQDRALVDNHQRRIETMHKAMQKASRLTQHLLRLAHPQEPQMDVVCLAELMPAVVELLQAALGKRIAVETQVAPDLWPTEIDVAAFDAATLHLALATSGAMEEPEQLTIELRNGSADPGSEVELVMTSRGARLRRDDGARTPTDNHLLGGSGFAAAERFAAHCRGRLSVAPVGESGMCAILSLPRCHETTTA